MIFHNLVVSMEACVERACHTCLLTSAPAWSSHRRHSGWPPNAAMWVGVCANRDVTAFTPQPTWTRRITHSSCGSKDTAEIVGQNHSQIEQRKVFWLLTRTNLTTAVSLNSESKRFRKRWKADKTNYNDLFLRYLNLLGNVNTSR